MEGIYTITYPSGSKGGDGGGDWGDESVQIAEFVTSMENKSYLYKGSVLSKS